MLDDELAVLAQCGDFFYGKRAECRTNFIDVGAMNLNHGTEFFVEQRGHCVLVRRIKRYSQTCARGDHHLDQHGEQATVGAVVIGEQQTVCTEFLHACEERFQIICGIAIRHFRAHRRLHLIEDRATHALLAARDVDQQQHGVVVDLQEWRQRFFHVAHIGKRGDDQRHWSVDGPRCLAIAPARAHAHRVLAHRDRHTERGAQLHAHGLHRVEQRSVFAGHVHCGHPVGGELNVCDRRNRCCRNVGDGLSHRHARRRRCVEHRQRRALAHRHCLASVAHKISKRHRNVCHRHLPRPDHLLAGSETADEAVTNGDEKGFVGDRGVLQHAIRRVTQLQFHACLSFCGVRRFTRCDPLHLRRLA